MIQTFAPGVTALPHTPCMKFWSPVAIKLAASLPNYWNILQAGRDFPAVRHSCCQPASCLRTMCAQIP